MKIQTFSIITGTSACNANCPFCISKMTGVKNIQLNQTKVNWRNFEKACRLAQINNVTTVLLTGKGEPLLFPKQITEYLEHLAKYNFPLIELQTNGLLLDYQVNRYKKYLEEWFDLGLSLIAISTNHYQPAKNQEIFNPNTKYIDLRLLVSRLHQIGYSVRLSCTLIKDFIDRPEEIKKMVEFVKSLGAEQLSLRPVTRPSSSENQKIADWVDKNKLSDEEIKKIRNFLDQEGHRLVTYGHGSVLYDLNGQNVCLTNALTIKPEADEIRQLIYFPDGHLKFDWQYKGATIL